MGQVKPIGQAPLNLLKFDRDPHHNGYFFVINKDFVKDLATLQTGIFVYIK